MSGVNAIYESKARNYCISSMTWTRHKHPHTNSAHSINNSSTGNHLDDILCSCHCYLNTCSLFPFRKWSRLWCNFQSLAQVVNQQKNQFSELWGSTLSSLHLTKQHFDKMSAVKTGRAVSEHYHNLCEDFHIQKVQYSFNNAWSEPQKCKMTSALHSLMWFYQLHR